MKPIRYYILATVLGLFQLTSCTDLEETLYDQVGTQNYYNTKNDVVRATFRLFVTSSAISRGASTDTGLSRPHVMDGGTMAAAGADSIITIGM